MNNEMQLAETNLLDSPEVLRQKVLAIEALMREQGTPVEIVPKHYFAPGLYAREITIPKGTLATSKIHLFEHIDIISSGEISVLTDEGMKRIKAPATFVSKPGLKRIGYAHEDTVWISIIACSETDPEKAEKLLVVDTQEEFKAAIEGGTWPLLP